MTPQDWALSVFGRVPTNLIRCDHRKLETYTLGIGATPHTYVTWCRPCQLMVRTGIMAMLLQWEGLHALLRANGPRYRQPMSEDPLGTP